MHIKSFLFENKTIKQTILKNTFWLMFAEGISKGLTFFLTILIARSLGAAGYGKFSFAFAFVALFAVIADFGLSTLTIREVARNKSLARKYIDNIAVVKLILGLITFGLIVITIQFLGKTPEVKTLVYLAGIWVVVQSFTQFFQSIFRAFEKMQYEALSKTVYSLLLFSIAGFILWQNLGIKLLVTSYIVATAIALAFTLILVRKNFTKFWAEIDFGFWKGLLRPGFIIFASSITFILYFKIDIVMLSFMKNDQSVGLYSAVYNFIFAFAIIPSILTNTVYPYMSKQSTKNKKILKKGNLFLSLVILIPILGFYLFKKEIIQLLYGTEYFQGLTVVLPLSLSFFCFSLAHLNYFYLYSRKKEGLILRITSMGVPVNIMLNLLLIPKYSLVGAAYASFITELIILLVLIKINFYV